jgi:hypothetical protein
VDVRIQIRVFMKVLFYTTTATTPSLLFFSSSLFLSLSNTTLPAVECAGGCNSNSKP